MARIFLGLNPLIVGSTIRTLDELSCHPYQHTASQSPNRRVNHSHVFADGMDPKMTEGLNPLIVGSTIRTYHV